MSAATYCVSVWRKDATHKLCAHRRYLVHRSYLYEEHIGHLCVARTSSPSSVCGVIINWFVFRENVTVDVCRHPDVE